MVDLYKQKLARTSFGDVNLGEYYFGFHHPALYLTLLGSRAGATHVPTNMQANYMATQGPQAPHDLHTA